MLRDWLRVLLPGVPCYLVVPETPPACFIIVERVGGMVGLHEARPLFALQAYADTRINAAKLAELLAEQLYKLTELDNVAKVSVEGVTHFPVAGPPFLERYQILMQVTTAVEAVFS